jgi:ubiquinone/menaquinone biosynthesis C-methylase UbiE
VSSLAFDKYATVYDGHFTHSPIGVLQRQQVYSHLLKLLDRNMDLLELNCGTGHDALTIASMVRSVTALDISESMIAQARQKQGTQNTSNLQFLTADMRQLDLMSDKKFHLVFSNFGGLNFLSPDELQKLSFDLENVLHPGGSFLSVVMGRKCLWENLFFRFRKDPSAGRRSQKDGIPTSIDGGDPFLTFYHSPGEMQEIFRKFRIKLVRPIGLFVPPSYLNDYFQKRPWSLKVLGTLDKIFGRLASLSNRSDHFLIHFEKTAG